MDAERDIDFRASRERRVDGEARTRRPRGRDELGTETRLLR